MNTRLMNSIIAPVLILVFSMAVFAQSDHGLNGVWARRGNLRTLSDPPPPMTPEGRARYNANKPSYDLPSDRRAIPPAQGNDPTGRCDPLGLLRTMFAIQPVEFFVTPNRVFQFFQRNKIWRFIWTDERKLPEEPEPAWYGHSVGRWEGDTLVVESVGFDDRTWLDQYGHPFSEKMRVTERWRRVNNTLELNITVNDPETYTKPWVSDKIVWELLAKEELIELVCAPIDEQFFNTNIRDPAAGKTGQ